MKALSLHCTASILILYSTIWTIPLMYIYIESVLEFLNFKIVCVNSRELCFQNKRHMAYCLLRVYGKEFQFGNEKF